MARFKKKPVEIEAWPIAELLAQARGEKGEFYPIKPDIFDITYEAI
jgi:hypothetical protein